jgi:hypothetical protein
MTQPISVIAAIHFFSSALAVLLFKESRPVVDRFVAVQVINRYIKEARYFSGYRIAWRLGLAVQESIDRWLRDSSLSAQLGLAHIKIF